jgi:Zn-dependent protease
MTVTFLFIFVAWIFSLCIHEFSHAIVAYKGGDYTVVDKGYLSLNPLKFADPLLSIGLPLVFLFLGGIGLPGGCVYIERHLLRSKAWDCLVSLAGPASNLTLAVLLASPFYLGFVDTTTANPMWDALAFLVVLQILAMVFNLLPVPGLDGFGAISAWMEPGLRARIYQYSNMAFIALIIIIWNVQIARDLLIITVYNIAWFLQVPSEMINRGREAFMIF